MFVYLICAEIKDTSKSDFGKLNIEEELARAKEENTNLSEPNSGLYFI